MIPKNCYLISVKNNLHNIDYYIKIFLEINNSFKIESIILDDIINHRDSIAEKAKNLSKLNTDSISENKYKFLYHYKMLFMKKYGGICLDINSVPIKEIDNSILKDGSFFSNSKNNNFSMDFFGIEKDSKYNFKNIKSYISYTNDNTNGVWWAFKLGIYNTENILRYYKENNSNYYFLRKY